MSSPDSQKNDWLVYLRATAAVPHNTRRYLSALDRPSTIGTSERLSGQAVERMSRGPGRYPIRGKDDSPASIASMPMDSRSRTSTGSNPTSRRILVEISLLIHAASRDIPPEFGIEASRQGFHQELADPHNLAEFKDTRGVKLTQARQATSAT